MFNLIDFVFSYAFAACVISIHKRIAHEIDRFETQDSFDTRV